MKIPLLDLKAQYISLREEIDGALKRVVESQYFILSPEVKALEEEIAAYTGAAYGCGVASGTDALVLSLRVLGIGGGDIVITTPFTFFATGESISILGARPFFVDVDPDTYNMDPGKLRGCLAGMDPQERDRVKAVLPVHIYGQCADMTGIMDAAREYGLKVVEDCAQAIGAGHRGGKAGSFGDAGCFSFFPSKNLGGFGDGGMVVTSDPAVEERVRRLRVHGSREQYVHDEIAYNSRLDSIQAAVLRVKLKKLDEWFAGRRKIAARYDEAFSSLGVKIPVTSEANTHTYHQYTIAVDDRDGLMAHLREKGVASRVYYPVPLHLQPCYSGLGFSIGSLPVAESLAEKVISIPVYPELTDEQVDHIIDSVTGFVNGR